MRLKRLRRQAWDTLMMAMLSAGSSVAAVGCASRAWQIGQSGGAALLAGALGALLTILLVAEARRVAILAMVEEKWQGGMDVGQKFAMAFSMALVVTAILMLVACVFVLFPFL